MTHPAIRDLLLSPGRHGVFQELLHRLQPGAAGQWSLGGLTTTAKALYLVLLRLATERPLVVVVDGSKQAETLAELVRTFHELLVVKHDGRRPQLIPALDVLPHQDLTPHSEILERRAIGLYRLAAGAAPITITPVASALLRTEEADYYRQLALTLRVGEDVPLEDLVAHLESIGYQAREPVEMTGEYSVRGGIIDIFPAEAGRPVRLELFGDTIESMRRFDVETQRSVQRTDDCVLLPLAEHPRSRILPAETARPRTASLWKLAGPALVVLDEPEKTRGAAERLWKRLESAPSSSESGLAERNFYRWEEWEAELAGAPLLLLRELEITTQAGDASHIPSRPSIAFHGNMPVAVAEARNLVTQGHRVVFFGSSAGEVERLADIFNEYGVPFQLALDPSDGVPAYLAERAYVAGAVSGISLTKGLVRRGFVLADSQLAIFGAEDLFDVSELVARPASTAAHLATFSFDLGDLKPGDYVVHTTHGIGRFLGLREISHDDRKDDFMLLEYASEAKLYLPLARLDLVQKYRGAGQAEPALDKLGGASWEKTRGRVKSKMRDMAEELLRLYAQRELAEGFAFSADSNWQREFEDAFEFTETRDQTTSVREIKRDMERLRPMDRLLCGDVGFGKTEVAMRSAFKALGDGKQVAVLAPTTVLCFQHYETFKSRFAPFPVRVEMISRFRTPKYIKAVLAQIAAGQVDIAIGTHRLLSRDVEFRDLGLLVIDEEQRFGVRHKERLKELRKDVDVLTMTATPIPRTLHMSLTGLRDLSVIETPPKDRLAIHTVVTHYHPDLIRTAIEQELARGGQVFFVHNRVETIWNRAAMIRQMLPECRIGVGHGQMEEAALEKVMVAFMRHEFDVLVSTTIIENGLDIPLANTILIDHAERFGLSELYQLRGRVGRSDRRAYAYLLVPPDTELSELARKRLAALREFSELGAGFKIAALDLELRGAGNMLGGEQHGHIDAVGYDTYVRMLEETVGELRGQERAPEIHVTINLGLDLRIPPGYVAEEHQRLRAYKRIADCNDPAQARAVLEEFEDRYGPPPESVRHLVRFAVLKSLAGRLAIESIERRRGAVEVRFHPGSKVDPARLMDLVARTREAELSPSGTLKLPLGGVAAPGALLDGIETRLLELLGP